MKTVLIVASDFPPRGTIGSQRPIRFCRHLPAHGWRAIVLTTSERCAFPRDDSLMRWVPEGLHIVRTPCRAMYEHSSHFRHRRATGLLKRLHVPFHAVARALNGQDEPDPLIRWLPGACRAAAAIYREHAFDVVLGSLSPWSVGLIVRAIGNRLSVPYVIDARDPWTLAPGFGAGMSAVRVERERAMERTMLADASGFVANTIGQQELFGRAFPEALREKSIVVNNSFDLVEWADVPRHRFDRFTLLHGGNIHRSRSLVPVMRALALLRDRGDISPGRLQLLHYGVTEEREPAGIRELKLQEWVRFERSIPREEFAPMLRGADLLLVTERWPFAIPGKTFDYLATENPILVVAPRDGDIAGVVLEAGQGFVVPEGETEELAAVILKAFRLAEAGRPLLPEYAPQRRLRFSSPVTTGSLAGLLNRVAADQPAVTAKVAT